MLVSVAQMLEISAKHWDLSIAVNQLLPRLYFLPEDNLYHNLYISGMQKLGHFASIKDNFFVVLGFELRAHTLSHSASPFCDETFPDSLTNYLSVLVSILLIPAS
jgi:hypothetical protein